VKTYANEDLEETVKIACNNRSERKGLYRNLGRWVSSYDQAKFVIFLIGSKIEMHRKFGIRNLIAIRILLRILFRFRSTYFQIYAYRKYIKRKTPKPYAFLK
jgi:hypothetical protein